MEVKIVKVTDKGQISIPVGIRETAKISVGDNLLIMQNNKTIVIKKIEEDSFNDLLKHSEKVANKLWDNKEDEIWNKV